jgi:hypothetical protein
MAQPDRAQWIHGKRKVVEPYGLLSAHELAERVWTAFGCPHYGYLSLAENVARSCTRAKVLGSITRLG